MNVLITGVSGAGNIGDVKVAMALAPFRPTLIWSLGFEGIDKAAIAWANEVGIPVQKIPYQKSKDDNYWEVKQIQKAITLSDAVVCIEGTASNRCEFVVTECRKLSKRIFIVPYEANPSPPRKKSIRKSPTKRKKKNVSKNL